MTEKDDLSQEYFLWYFQQVRILAAPPNLLGIYIEILVNTGYFYKRYP